VRKTVAECWLLYNSGAACIMMASHACSPMCKLTLLCASTLSEQCDPNGLNGLFRELGIVCTRLLRADVLADACSSSATRWCAQGRLQACAAPRIVHMLRTQRQTSTCSHRCGRATQRAGHGVMPVASTA
jgi:hypothetical protein